MANDNTADFMRWMEAYNAMETPGGNTAGGAPDAIDDSITVDGETQGFTNLTFRGVPLVYDRLVDTNRVYGANTGRFQYITTTREVATAYEQLLTADRRYVTTERTNGGFEGYKPKQPFWHSWDEEDDPYAEPIVEVAGCL